VSPRDRLTAGISVAYLIVLLCGVFCTVLLSLERAFGETGVASLLTASISLVTVAWICFQKNEWIASRLGRAVDRVERVPARIWILAVIVVGSLLRIAWAVAIPQVATSDYLSYLKLASGLVERGEYWLGHTCFLRPPGVSLSLVPFVAVFGAKSWVPLIHNLMLYAITVPAVFALARRAADDRVAVMSVGLLAIWPNGIFLSGLASKELLLLLLLPATAVVYLRGMEGDENRCSAGVELTAGLLLGAAILTQPTFLLMVGVLMVVEGVRGPPSWRAARRLALLVVGAALVVAPWTLRNFLASGRFLLVSANGGQTLWVANNPEATGGFVSVADDRAQLDEISYDRVAFRRAIRWIWDNPRRFLALAIRKQILFLGDDADGAYWTLKRGIGIAGSGYAVAKGISNLFWIGVLALGIVAVRRFFRRPLLTRPSAVFLMLPLLFQVVIFSITESGGRHHVAIMGFIVVLSSLSVAKHDGPSTQEVEPIPHKKIKRRPKGRLFSDS
jgi:4-amino-4-deoxy-L-arabinose transferase-like glycosyltransferase